MVQVSQPPGKHQPFTSLESLAGHLGAGHLQAIQEQHLDMQLTSCPGCLELLCTPLLWEKCRSIKPLTGTFLGLLLSQLDSLKFVESTLSSIEVQGALGTGEVMLALLGNLLLIGRVGVKVESGTRLVWSHSFWCNLTSLVFQLLTHLPLRQLFPAVNNKYDDDEPSSSGFGAWSNRNIESLSRDTPPELLSQVRLLVARQGQDFLKALVHGVLPRTAPAMVMGQADWGALSQGASSLCGLLSLMHFCQERLQQQSWLVSLAVSGQFVQRLWFTYLRAGWRELLEGSHVGVADRYVVPLLVLSQVYSCFLVTAGVEEVCKRQEPLPLNELYDPANPTVGFIPMLREAMWQVCLVFCFILDCICQIPL